MPHVAGLMHPVHSMPSSAQDPDPRPPLAAVPGGAPRGTARVSTARSPDRLPRKLNRMDWWKINAPPPPPPPPQKNPGGGAKATSCKCDRCFRMRTARSRIALAIACLRGHTTSEEKSPRPAYHSPGFRQTRGIEPMWNQCWSTVYDAGPTLVPHWFIV